MLMLASAFTSREEEGVLNVALSLGLEMSFSVFIYDPLKKNLHMKITIYNQ